MISICSGNGLTPNRWQDMIWTYDGIGFWRMYVPVFLIYLTYMLIVTVNLKGLVTYIWIGDLVPPPPPVFVQVKANIKVVIKGNVCEKVIS